MSLLPARYPLHAVAVATTLALSSCGGDGGNSGSVASPATLAPPPRIVPQSDLEIAQALYSGTPRTPPGFYADAAAPMNSYASTVHLKNTDLDATLTAPAPQHELCTNDWNQALDWSESRAQAAAAYADLVATNDDPRYFEFDRVRNGEPQLYLRERVFKCAYVNRESADLRSPEGAAGKLNQRPLTAEELRTLAEYLWQFTSYNNFGHAVLKSSGAASTTALSHTLIIANLVRSGLSGTCDRIDVIAWHHSVDLGTGELALDIETLFSFGARESAGSTSLCTG
ncbi:MAG TPA: hypothetical protein VKB34_11970 [Povalibacter sp.]|nr:hypothetical protein [Povalibacter sp.]